MKSFRKILVGNLGSDTEKSSITDLFMRANGTVISTDLPVDQKGKTRGYAFVEMATQLEAEQAIKTLDGAEICGRRITMTLAEVDGDHKKKRKWFKFGS
jgi:RNA recognition motif-containing protein